MTHVAQAHLQSAMAALQDGDLALTQHHIGHAFRLTRPPKSPMDPEPRMAEGPHPEAEDMPMGKLTTQERKAMPQSEFALPGGRYPIENASHARNALARVAQHGNAEEKAKVRSAVHRKFPEIGQAHATLQRINARGK